MEKGLPFSRSEKGTGEEGGSPDPQHKTQEELKNLGLKIPLGVHDSTPTKVWCAPLDTHIPVHVLGS